jgi:hypothetical protein
MTIVEKSSYWKIKKRRVKIGCLKDTRGTEALGATEFKCDQKITPKE